MSQPIIIRTSIKEFENEKIQKGFYFLRPNTVRVALPHIKGPIPDTSDSRLLGNKYGDLMEVLFVLSPKVIRCEVYRWLNVERIGELNSKLIDACRVRKKFRKRLREYKAKRFTLFHLAVDKYTGLVKKNTKRLSRLAKEKCRSSKEYESTLALIKKRELKKLGGQWLQLKRFQYDQRFENNFFKTPAGIKFRAILYEIESLRTTNQDFFGAIRQDKFDPLSFDYSIPGTISESKVFMKLAETLRMVEGYPLKSEAGGEREKGLTPNKSQRNNIYSRYWRYKRFAKANLVNVKNPDPKILESLETSQRLPSGSLARYFSEYFPSHIYYGEWAANEASLKIIGERRSESTVKRYK